MRGKLNLRVALAQIDPTVGGIKENVQKISQLIVSAAQRDAEVIVFPELAVTGYPPEDLLLKPRFVSENLGAVEGLAKKVGDFFVIVGFVDRDKYGLYNAAAVIHNKKILYKYHKILLPNYGVFDEVRYFTPGDSLCIFPMGGTKLGINICEDIWKEEGPTKALAKRGAKLIINISASPYHAGKIKVRQALLRGRAKAYNLFVIYDNMVGGQDELIFDGQSLIIDRWGRVLMRGKAFEEELIIEDIELNHKAKRAVVPIEGLSVVEEVYKGLTMGIRDYVRKNGFKKVLIGLSGGIDSCLTAAIAVDALGGENVIGVFMPSQYSSQESQEYALALANNLKMEFKTIDIEPIFRVYKDALKPQLGQKEEGIAFENIQARIRGNILMALSNQFGHLVLTTGNKSEMGVGYATLYGDMAGGLAALKDVPKTLVYSLSKYRNSVKAVIPEGAIMRPPSAELKAHQKDIDTLPPYEVLDPILKAYIEDEKGRDEICNAGFDRKVVERVIRMVDANEYKRRQSPPGIKITPKAFGRDRRMPITNRFVELGC